MKKRFLLLLALMSTAALSAQTTLSFEAESLSFTGSGATTSVQTDANSSGGKWVELAGNSIGDSISFTLPNIPTGTYQLKMEWKGNANRGRLQLSVDGANLGSVLDQYSASQTYPTTTFGNVTFSMTGNHTVKLTVTGKNSASSGYILSADKFTLVAQTSPVATPVFSPAPGTYPSAQSVTIASATSGASIRYTTDGSTPSETIGTLYSGPVFISGTATLKAIAYKTGLPDSSIVTGTYTINPPPPAAAPTFTPAGGTYVSTQSVTITSATAGASIRYTTDGSAPSETIGTLYSGPVTVSSNVSLKAIAFEAGFTDSPISSASYTITPPAAAPVFSPVPGTYPSAQSVTITSATSGASIRYTTDGSTPSETVGTLYSGPVNIGATATLNAIAYAVGRTDSTVTSGTYVISTGTVTFENNGTKEGWSNYPQTPQAEGTITDVSSPTYHSTSAIEFTQTFVSGYTGRYHSEVDLENAQQTDQDRYYGMTFFLPAGWQYAYDQVNVQQWAGTGPWIIFRVDGPDIIVLFDHLPDGFFDEPHIYRNVPSGVWMRVVTHIRSSVSGGIWECWINGNHVYSHTGDLDAPNNGGAIRWSTGCYVSGWYQQTAPQGPSERIVYGTHYRVTTSYDLAEPANW